MKKEKKRLGNPKATWEDIQCQNLSQHPKNPESKICKIASEAQGYAVPTSAYICSICSQSEMPQQLGNLGIQIATAKAAKETNKFLYFSAEERLGHGPGTELHKLIPKFLENPTCNCKNWAKKMNIWGVEGCEKNKETIINKLISESTKRSVLSWVPEAATRIVAERLVNLAIEKALKNKQNQKFKWHAVVTTAPRRDPTLPSCLDSLMIAGWDFNIFAEPANYDFLNQQYQDKTIFNKERKGVWWNWIESARWALENTDADVIMTVQDDALFHPDSKGVAEKFLWPDERVGFVSLYTPKHYSTKMNLKSRPERPLGLNRIHTKALWGSCALVWPRKVLEQVMDHELIEGWLGAPIRTKSAWKEKQKKRKEEPWTIQNSDTAIGKIMNWTNRTMWFLDPSPVQHIAQYSAINHGGNKGRRNCGRCAKYSQPLSEQLPFHINGEEDFKIYDTSEIIL
jgi:hypothetical protein